MIKVTDNHLDFSELHERMQWYVDEGIIPFCNTLIMQGTDVVDVSFHESADRRPGHQSARPLSADSIFRMHSSTKIATSIAAMMLYEEGRFALDDPLTAYLPEFDNMTVLKAGATGIEDTEPATGAILIKQILSHTAGLSYGFVEPESIIDQAYTAANISPLAPAPDMTLESLCASLSNLPLAFQPGSWWRYSFATDVTARLVEVLSGQRFDSFLKARIFDPLNMVDTDFCVPEAKLPRFTTMYNPSDPLDPMSGDLKPGSNPYEGARSGSFLSGGGGLMSTLVDYLTFLTMIIRVGGGDTQQLIQPETLALMRTNQCADGVIVNFPFWDMPGTVFGLGFALKQQAAAGEPDTAINEYHWGGLAGTHLWISPLANIAGICMTQRMPAFWHPFSHDFKRLAYQIAG